VELKSKQLDFINKHFSLLVLVLASGAFFLTNIILKEHLSSENYGLYSIFITYISLLSSFGMLGLEQVIMRNSKILSDKVIISKNLLIPIILSILFVSILGSYLFINNYNISATYIFLSIITLLVILTKLISNLFRLLSMFTFSQIALNLWKLALFLVLLILIFRGESINIKDINSIIFLLLVVTMFMVFFIIRRVKFSHTISIESFFSQAFLFLLSLVTISLINYGDRFFIESRFGLDELGSYFFFINLFLFPFTLLQSYVGFKEIISFKLLYNHSLLVKKLNQILRYSILFAIFLFVFAFLIDFFGFYKIDLLKNLQMIVLFLMLGIIKVIYSIFSSAMGAICDNKMLYKTNMYSIISILLLIPVIYYYATTITITIMFLIVLWIIRCIIWYKQLSSFEN
jgi:O-antigen/teichoic acid export membrane protein